MMNQYKAQAILNKTGIDPTAKPAKVENWGLWDIQNKCWIAGVHGSYQFCKGMKNKMERESKFVILKILPYA